MYSLLGGWEATEAGDLNLDVWFILPEPDSIASFDRMLRSEASAEPYFRNIDIQPSLLTTGRTYSYTQKQIRSS